jgi:hypothetical protein
LQIALTSLRKSEKKRSRDKEIGAFRLPAEVIQVGLLVKNFLRSFLITRNTAKATAARPQEISRVVDSSLRSCGTLRDLRWARKIQTDFWSNQRRRGSVDDDRTAFMGRSGRNVSIASENAARADATPQSFALATIIIAGLASVPVPFMPIFFAASVTVPEPFHGSTTEFRLAFIICLRTLSVKALLKAA